MSSKILNLLHEEFKKRNIINGIAFLSSKEGISNKNKIILEDIINQYQPNTEKEETLPNLDEEFYYEEMYKQMKINNIMKAIILLDKHKCLNMKYIKIVRDIVDKGKGYQM